MLRMKHERHGYTHAYNPVEESRLRMLGWIGEGESFEPEGDDHLALIQESTRNEPTAEKKRRGRPPKDKAWR